MLAKLVKISQETPDTRTFSLKPEAPISYKSGQFLMIGLKGGVDAEGNKIPKRAYSLASCPGDDTIDITLNLYPNGKLSPHLFNMKIGDELDIAGPYGHFYLKDESKNIVLIAGGTGIAPLRSMWRHIFNKNIDAKVTLFYSSKTPVDIIYKEELSSLMNHPQFRCTHTITRPDGHQWDGRTGRIDRDLIKTFVEDMPTAHFYICGSPDMANSMIKILEELGVPKERINSEKW